MTVSAPATEPTPTTGVRCPSCGAKIAEELAGKLVVTCRHCKKRVTLIVHPD